ncbi:MAG TPA: hypothetical protein VGA60_04315 [Kiloniellales bacterium]|jgi:hypothetical protein
MPTFDTLLQSPLAWLASDLATPLVAYLDPGTGSMIVQLLLGGVAGALMIGKLYWQKIKGFFGRPRPARPAESQDD